MFSEKASWHSLWVAGWGSVPLWETGSSPHCGTCPVHLPCTPTPGLYCTGSWGAGPSSRSRRGSKRPGLNDWVQGLCEGMEDGWQWWEESWAHPGAWSLPCPQWPAPLSTLPSEHSCPSVYTAPNCSAQPSESEGITGQPLMGEVYTPQPGDHSLCPSTPPPVTGTPSYGTPQLRDRDPLQGCRLRSKPSGSSNTRMVTVTTGQQDLSPGGLWGSTQQAQCFPTTGSRRPAAQTCQPRGLCSEVRFRRKNVALKTFIDANTWRWCHPQGTHMRRGDQGGGDSAERDPTHLCSALRQEPHRKLASEMTCATLPCFTEPLLRNAEHSFSFKWERK